jgi:hypothetical protein
VVVRATGALKGFLFYYYIECKLGLFAANFNCALIAIDGGLVIIAVVTALFGATITTSNEVERGCVVASGSCICMEVIG